jgi:DNA polymerase
MNPLVIDFETRSPLDLRKVGIYKYVDDPRTTILCFHISCGDNSGTFFDPTWGNLPGWAQWALDDDAVDIHAHNATVERLLIQRICHKRHGWPLVDTGRFRCSATRAARLALPRALEKVGAALGLETQKDKEGTRIMRRLSRPIKTGPDGFVYDNDPEKLKRLGDYCQRDVETEIALEASIFLMPPEEEALYQLTERVNDRGIRVDVPLVQRLLWRANECMVDLNARMAEITNGAVKALTEVEKLKTWIYDETGVRLPKLRKEDMRDIFDDATITHSFPKHVEEAIKIRQEGAKSSVSKLVAILNRVSSDGRLHGAFVHHGASTGRWTSMGVQLQNLRRDTLKDFDKDIEKIDTFTLDQISRTLRACFIPSEGHLFVDADYNAIEARGIAWLAGAEKLLDIYHRKGDPYCEMATVIYGKKINKDDHPAERFVGKQIVLGAGYGLGPPKFEAMCAHFGQPVSEAISIKAVKAYRSEFAEIPECWYDIQGAAIKAVDHKGRTFTACNGKIAFRVKDGYLQMRLPSGRRLFYKSPLVRYVDKWDNGREVPELSYMAEHPITKQWTRERTWGGKIAENAVQAICRDLLFHSMQLLEYEFEIPIVMSVHDQIVTEVLAEDAEWAKKRIQKVMECPPDWAADFPIAAEPKIMKRFGK